jgi:AraC-like DNA-binding protein
MEIHGPNSIEPSITVGTGKAICSVLPMLGCTTRFYDVCEDYGLSRELFRYEHNKIPLDAILDFANDQAVQLGEPLIGLKVAKILSLNKLPCSKDLLFVAHDVKQAIEIFDRYTQVFADVGRFEWVRQSDKCALVFRPNSKNAFIRHLIDVVMMNLLRYMKILGADVFTSLHFEHRCPVGYQKEYENKYCLPVTFNNKETWFELSPESLSQSLDACPNPSVKYFSEAEKILGHFKGDSSVGEQVNFILSITMATRQISAERMADILGMNMRTFQRRLKGHNLKYRDMLESVRRSLAVDYLIHERLPIDQVSKQLGYTDISNFYRAFKNWTGMRPAEYRNIYPKLG